MEKYTLSECRMLREDVENRVYNLLIDGGYVDSRSQKTLDGLDYAKASDITIALTEELPLVIKDGQMSKLWTSKDSGSLLSSVSISGIVDYLVCKL